MHPDGPPIESRPRRRGGFALVAALALLVVLGSTGAMMLRMTGTQHAGNSAAILGLRADWAAQSGVEWALFASRAAGGCPAPVTHLSLDEGALGGFGVVVRCTESSHFEGSLERKSLVFQAEASFGTIGDRDFVYREFRAEAML